MKSLLGQVAFKSSETLEWASYEKVAAEYYDAARHPTCADFRSASKICIARVFESERPSGAIADIGCGQSLLAEFVSDDLVLVDESKEMLDRNIGQQKKYQLNVAKHSFGASEFDWIFAVLADPYNVFEAWKNIEKALKRDGKCVFIVPSHRWTEKFRALAKEEKPGFARFDLASGASLFLPSIVLTIAEQTQLISSVGLSVEKIENVFVKDIAEIKSPKIAQFLKSDDPILDIYKVQK